MSRRRGPRGGEFRTYSSMGRAPIVRPGPRGEVAFQHDRPSGHWYRERERQRAHDGFVRIADLVPDSVRELMKQVAQ